MIVANGIYLTSLAPNFPYRFTGIVDQHECEGVTGSRFDTRCQGRKIASLGFDRVSSVSVFYRKTSCNIEIIIVEVFVPKYGLRKLQIGKLENWKIMLFHLSKKMEPISIK